jgi:hypothetical protein
MNSTIRNEARQIIRQSIVIHPDWTAESHVSYLLNDAFLPISGIVAETLVADELEAAWYRGAERALESYGRGFVMKDWTDAEWEATREAGMSPEVAVEWLFNHEDDGAIEANIRRANGWRA